MTKALHLTATALLVTAAIFSLNSATAQSTTAGTTELSFSNPVLKSGVSKQPGSIYRFSNVAPGVDAEILLKKFSRPDIFIESIDVTEAGFDKAFQPKFGINKAVAPNQNWYIDFKMNFYKSGTTTPVTLSKVSFTALDIDGDNHTIQEYNQFYNASTRQYATNTLLTDSATPLPVFSSGSPNSNQNFSCSICGASGKIKKCKDCGGSGVDGSNNQCPACAGSGYTFKDCAHPFAVVSQAKGSIKDFNSANGIDTLSTQVMVTYTYLNKNEISFRYGATTATTAVTSTAVRLNSVWAKSFSLAPAAAIVAHPLPVRFLSFTTQYTGSEVAVKWQTAGEENLSHFVVQRSGDGKNFRDVAMIFASNMGSYSYKDKSLGSLSAQVVYYRILGVDNTGEVSPTSLSLVRLSKVASSSVAISAFPNPAASELRVSFPAAWAAKQVSLELYSTGGEVVKTIQYKEAGESQSLNLGSLKSGTYILKASCLAESTQLIIAKL